MTSLRVRLRDMCRLGLAKDDIDAEFEFHLSMEAERLVAAGVSREVATTMAIQSFGDVASLKRECREIRGGIIEDVAAEIRSACRSLVAHKQPAFIAFAGLTAAMTLLVIAFSTLDRGVVHPLPYRDANRMVRLWSSVPGVAPDQRWGFATAEFMYMRRESKVFRDMGLYRFASVSARNGEKPPRRVTAMVTSDGTLRVLNIDPVLGRNFSKEEILGGAPTAALISYESWQSLYDGDPLVVGKTIQVDERTARIVGVLPADAIFPEEIEEKDFKRPAVLLPLRLNPSDPAENHHVFRAIGILRAGQSIDDASHELNRLARRLPDVLPSAYTPTFMSSTRFGIEAAPLGGERREDVIAPIVFMLCAAALLLAVACAGTWSVPVREKSLLPAKLATEMTLLLVPAAFFSCGIAPVLLRVWPRINGGLLNANVTTSGVMATLGIASLAAIVIARLRATHTQPTTAARISIFTQVTVATSLIIATVIGVRGVNALRSVTPGFDVDDAVATSVHLPAAKYASHEAVSEFYERLADRIANAKGVVAVGMTSALPLQGFDGCSGVTVDHDRSSGCVPVYFVRPGYLHSLGARIVGREPTANDEHAVVVSAAFAKRAWPGQHAIGRTLRLGPSALPYQVVGVANDVKSRGLDQDTYDDIYVPFVPTSGWNGWPPITNMQVVVRAPGVEPAGIDKMINKAIDEIDADVTVESARPLRDLITAATVRDSAAVPFISLSAVFALLISLISLISTLRAPARGTRVRTPTMVHV